MNSDEETKSKKLKKVLTLKKKNDIIVHVVLPKANTVINKKSFFKKY